MFPNREHHTGLRKRLADAGWRLDSLDRQTRFEFHAYDYGWRRWKLQDRNPVSPIDPNGQWFDASLVAAAERMWTGKGAPHRFEPATSQYEGREDWRKIPYKHLTHAEKAEWEKLDNPSTDPGGSGMSEGRVA